MEALKLENYMKSETEHGDGDDAGVNMQELKIKYCENGFYVTTIYVDGTFQQFVFYTPDEVKEFIGDFL